jgi:hypothetical protein
MRKDKINQFEEELRDQFRELMASKTGQKEVKQLVNECEDYFTEIGEDLESYMNTAYVALKECKENRKLYFQHYSAIKQFVDFQRKLNHVPTDDEFIIF